MHAKDTPGNVEEPVGDPAAFERLRRWGGDALVREMVALFLTEAPTRMARASESIRSGDSGTVQEVAHSLKSSSAQIGARRMHALCVQMEETAKGGDVAAAGALLERLEHELSRFHSWLREEGHAGR